MKQLVNRNIVIFSSVDWDTHKQLHHELTEFLIKRNNKILFVENTGSRSFEAKDMSRVKNRIINFIKSKKGFRSLKKNLTIFSPLFIPFHYNFFIQKFNNFIVSDAIISWSKYFNFDDTIVINFVPNPITYSITKNLDPSYKVYYMADDMTSGDKKRLDIENKIMKFSDLIFYTSENLKKKIIYKSKSEFLPNGVNFNLFNQNFKRKKNFKNKSFNIGYVGAIREIINENLLIKIAKKFPKDKIFLLGPVLHNFKKFDKLKNIKFLGYKKHSDIPKYLNEFDVGIIPYKVNNFTNSINPLKVYEYISAGLPVISTNLKGLNFLVKNKKQNLYLCKNENSFVDKLLRLKKNYKVIDKELSKNFLFNNSWEKRFLFLEKKIVENDYVKRNSEKKFIQKIYSYYNTNKIQYFKYSVISLIIVIFFLNNQISNLIFKKYSVQFKELKKNELVLVFSGFGSKKYANVDYQNRVIDLIHYHNKYEFKNIVVIGRSSKFDEGELMVNIFRKKFQDEILIINDGGSSFINVLKVNDVLKKEFSEINEINVISSPLYSRRLDLILKKNTDLQVTFLEPSEKHIEEKNLNYSSLFYEILAIIYYKFKKFI